MTVELNVTVRCGFGAIARPVLDIDDINGVVSVELDAMVGTVGQLSQEMFAFRRDPQYYQRKTMLQPRIADCQQCHEAAPVIARLIGLLAPRIRNDVDWSEL